ncbi:MAG: class I SAM-dependent methyltransferase, partial [Rhodospirillales bacterium]|nr:class I SAM-dependent methyltransferase [Rhodospirillales bacterium]
DQAIRYGVVEAVNEICNKYDYRLAFLTNEARRYLSFALQKA